MEKSKSQEWRARLKSGDKKLNKNRLTSLLSDRIIEMRTEGTGQNKMTVIVGMNYANRVIEIRNRKEADALADLATLNGFVVE